jgi:hypothetical protein
MMLYLVRNVLYNSAFFGFAYTESTIALLLHVKWINKLRYFPAILTFSAGPSGLQSETNP